MIGTYEEALEDYRRWMARPDVGFAFGHGCTIGSHPDLAALRRIADDKLAVVQEMRP